jgi:hypothetical protein
MGPVGFKAVTVQIEVFWAVTRSLTGCSAKNHNLKALDIGNVMECFVYYMQMI